MDKGVSTTLRPFMRMWSTAAKHELESLPRPLEVASTRVEGEYPLRILLMGTGLAMGFGVLHHDLALPGHLGRDIAAATGRGVDIDVSVELEMTPSRCRELVARMDPSRYDAVVLMVGMWDSYTMTPAKQWGADLDALLDELHSLTPVGQDVCVVTEPTTSPSRMVVTAPRWVMDHHATELNAQIERVCAAHPSATAVSLSDISPITDERHRSSDFYRVIAHRLAPQLVRVVSAAGRPRLMSLDRLDEAQRQKALDSLGIIDTGPEERFEQMVSLAQRMFQTSAAAISFIDGNRQWFKARRGIEFTQTSRRDAFCNVTIESADPLIVEDASLDYRFMDNPFVKDHNHIRFYAGHPLETPDGQRVGTLCVFDRESRRFGPDDVTALRRIALLVQDELWAMTQLSSP